MSGVIGSLLLLSAAFAVVSSMDFSNASYSSDVIVGAGCDTAEFCSSCVTMAQCGFCVADSGLDGRCVQLHVGNVRCESPRNVPVSSTFFTVFCFDFSACAKSQMHLQSCPNSSFFSWLPIIGLCLYLMFFAPGMGPLPWTVNAEIYPTWSRSACTGIATAVNWLSNLLVSFTFLSVVDEFGMKRYASSSTVDGFLAFMLIRALWLFQDAPAPFCCTPPWPR